MISLHYTSHTKAYNTIYTACNIVEAIYSFTWTFSKFPEIFLEFSNSREFLPGIFGMADSREFPVALDQMLKLHKVR